ncbi:MAG: sigma 54-interacting transcriptional regulator [Deltaproteobacteria bacterium]|nr:sigma 54-interacting transcriptional regulator [Deltaproteobacteria bacterium]
MNLPGKHRPLNIHNLDLTKVFSDLDAGVIIIDRKGTIFYYNTIQANVDGLVQSEVLNKSMLDIYHTTSQSSPSLQCLQSQKPIFIDTFLYRTKYGKEVNANLKVFPLFEEEELIGSICFIREYGRMATDVKQIPNRKILERTGKGTQITFKNIIGKNPAFIQAIQTAMRSAGSVSSVMLYGENGTGKELFAQSIHNYGKWKSESFTAINCSAIPENLLEGILFGTSKGAFTGALEKTGLFEQANGGTLFLDEINSMPIGLQAKLLRVIQEKKVRRVGSLTEIDIDLKLISSVNESPETAIESNRLRRDLFYRLAVVFVSIPPLRERLEDLQWLVPYFINHCNKKLNKGVETISEEVRQLFTRHNWPGNVRELEHVIEGSMNMISTESTISKHLLPNHFISYFTPSEETAESNTTSSLKSVSEEMPEANLLTSDIYSIDYTNRKLSDVQAEIETHIIREMIQRFDGNAAKAGKHLGMSRQLIYHKMNKLGISAQKNKKTNEI